MPGNGPSAEILGRWLFALHTLDMLADADQMAAFLQPMLSEAPGISDAFVCLGGTIHPVASASRQGVDCPRGVGPLTRVPRCALAERPDVRLVSIGTPRRAFGCLGVMVGDETEFANYQPFLINIGHMIATVLENAEISGSLAAANEQLTTLVDQLEVRVRDRTSDLEAANESVIREQTALKRANRMLLTLGAGDQALVHAEDEASLLSGIVEAVATRGHWRVAFVALREVAQDGGGQQWDVRGIAGAGASEVAAWFRLPDVATLLESMLGTGQNQIPLEVETPALGRLLVAALRDGPATIGVLCAGLGADAQDANDRQAVALLEQLAGDLAYGLGRLRDIARVTEGLAQTIVALGSTIEVRDPYTAGHQRRVSEIARAIAERLGWTAFDVEGVRVTASIHDIGKIAIPAEILTRPGRLMDLEMSLIKTHAQIGADIVAGIDFPWPVAEMIRQHHERLDGSGYPRGLSGGEILPGTNILVVADVFEAITHDRPYRRGWGIDVAIAELTRGRGLQYAPIVVDAYLAILAEHPPEPDRAPGELSFGQGSA